MKKNKVIYIVCPSEYSTGGVECLHQLSHKLLEKGIDARVFYSPSIKEDKMPRYSQYNVKKTEEIIENEENLIIFPEVWVDKINNYPKIKKAIWWLSVDNAKRNTTLPIGRMNKKLPWLKNRFPKLYDFLKTNYMKFNSKGKILFDFEKNKDVIHLAQSYYAKDFLEKNGVKKVFILRDYLNKEFFIKNTEKKEDIVIYNPQKGKEITKRLIEFAKDIKFIPLQNMTPKEVSSICSRAKVYIDFGTHPGRDKMPREAVVRNCCIIVGKKGSAKFLKDIPIKEEYRFDAENLDLGAITGKIRQCFKEYKVKIKDFNNYKKEVIDGEKLTEKEIDLFLKEIFI